MAVETQIQWRGTEEQQRVAQTVFELLTARSRFFSDSAPIRQKLSDLQKFFSSQESLRLRADADELAAFIDESLTENGHVFGRQQTDDGPIFVTTKSGAPPVDEPEVANAHTFRHRLFVGAREPTEEDLQVVRGVSRDIPEIIAAVPEPVHPVFPLDIDDDTDLPEAVTEEEERPAEVTVERDVAPATAAVSIGGTVVDLTQDPGYIVAEHGGLFKEMLGNYLDQDFRFVTFGDQYYVEDRLDRLSKGQLRDIRDYINERNEPLADEELLSDALRRPLQNADYELWRFTINYRLSREKKDFRFVGTRDDRLWATTSLPPVGQSFRKPAEIAAEYRYLNDPELSDSDPVSPASGEEASGRLELRHKLTWYESENGVLPVGSSAQLLMPAPLLEDQQVVVLRIQDPQNFATYLAELRLGGGSRGTYIAGLDELFQSTLVPGAVFTLVQGAASNEFTIEYERQPAQENRLLQYDPRKDRWFFGPVVYECPVDPSYLLSEERVGALSGKKRVSDAERRRPELLVQTAFELVGEKGEGGQLTALIEDLLPVANIERPFSREYIESVLTSTQYPQFVIEDASLGLAAYTG